LGLLPNETTPIPQYELYNWATSALRISSAFMLTEK
jgi:hypothetical protein